MQADGACQGRGADPGTPSCQGPCLAARTCPAGGAGGPGGHWTDGALSLAGSSQLVWPPSRPECGAGDLTPMALVPSGLWGGIPGKGGKAGLKGLPWSCAIQPTAVWKGAPRESCVVPTGQTLPLLTKPPTRPSRTHGAGAVAARGDSHPLTDCPPRACGSGTPTACPMVLVTLPPTNTQSWGRHDRQSQHLAPVTCSLDLLWNDWQVPASPHPQASYRRTKDPQLFEQVQR